MRPFFSGVCLLWLALPAFSQAQTPDASSALHGVPTTSQSQKLSFAQLLERKQAAWLDLKQPLDGSNRVAVVAWGKNALLLDDNGFFRVKSSQEIESLYGGSALISDVVTPALSVDDAVQIVPITSFGDNAEVKARYTLRNAGESALDVVVVSTSCGCTSARLDKNRLQPNESTALMATMHADSERLVQITLSTSDSSQPRLLLALQSKQIFAPFQQPSPLSLFGDKGQSITDSINFDLPVGWTIDRITTTPTWLQTHLRLDDADAKAKTPSLAKFQLSVAAPNSAPEGTLQGEVRLELKGAPFPFLAIPINGFVSNDIAVTPRVVVLSDSPLGIARRTVVVRGPQPFSIRAITSAMPGLKVRFEPSIQAKAHAVELLIPIRGEKGTPFFDRLQVALSDGRTLPLDITGTIGQGQLPALAQGLVLNAPAPAFSGTDTQGKTVSLSDFKGRFNVLLTFFPHCFTGGCESHLSSLRDANRAIGATGTRIVAVSTDDPAPVRAFASQLHLPFPVLSDTSRKIALAFGDVQNTKDAASRFSVLIDKSGKVRWIDTDVHVLTHGADVLTKIHQLNLNR